MNFTRDFIDRFWSKTKSDPDTGCIEFMSIDHNGYGIIKHNGKKYLSHRISYMIKNGDFNGIVCHKCNNRKCVNPEHLYVGTHKTNYEDMRKVGNHFRVWECKNKNKYKEGHEPSNRKLTEDDVFSIKILSRMGMTNRALAKLFCIDHSTVCRIEQNKLWKSVVA